eukprot:1006994-Rhodomonas_salina.1
MSWAELIACAAQRAPSASSHLNQRLRRVRQWGSRVEGERARRGEGEEKRQGRGRGRREGRVGEQVRPKA